jgi:hypothetical protein
MRSASVVGEGERQTSAFLSNPGEGDGGFGADSCVYGRPGRAGIHPIEASKAVICNDRFASDSRRSVCCPGHIGSWPSGGRGAASMRPCARRRSPADRGQASPGSTRHILYLIVASYTQLWQVSNSSHMRCTYLAIPILLSGERVLPYDATAILTTNIQLTCHKRPQKTCPTYSGELTPHQSLNWRVEPARNGAASL